MNISYELQSTKTLPRKRRISSRFLRAIGSVIIFLWGWYMCLSFRTTQFGEDGRSLTWYFVCSLVWVFLPSIILFLDKNLKKTVRRALIVTGITLLAVMVWANGEEALVISHYAASCTTVAASTCGDRVIINRAWPFHNHTLSYRVDTGWQGND